MKKNIYLCKKEKELRKIRLKMKRIIATFMALGSVLAYAQQGRVGINTTQPNATMQVVAGSGETKPGVIIPNVEKTGINVLEKGSDKDYFEESTLVYFKGDSSRKDEDVNSTIEEVSKKGFYYYDGKDWVRVMQKAQIYLPSIVLKTTAGSYTIDLYDVYLAQFRGGVSAATNTGTSTSSATTSFAKSSSNAILRVFEKTDLDYFITYFDSNVFSNVSVNANGVLTYDVTIAGENAVSEDTFMNIVLQEK